MSTAEYVALWHFRLAALAEAMPDVHISHLVRFLQEDM